MPEQQTRVLAGRYELITPLGRGTMGTVWRAHDRSLGREVAIKEIRQDPGLSQEQRAELRERMIREGRTAARISHPCVATVHDAIVENDSPWIIMELVQGRSLEQVIELQGPLPPRLVAEIGVDLLDALRAAHAQGVLHRDVKPANVLLTEGGRVVLTDFGIAKAAGDPSLTKTGMVIGSPGYTAPERARGEHNGPESDLWSLGATLYFAVEGRPAYERASLSETLAALMTEKADPPTQAGPLRPVLERLLERDHRRRPSPARAIAMLRSVADAPAAVTPAIEPPRPAGDVSSAAAGNSAEEEFDADRTVMVIRPKGGLRLPPGPRPAAPAAPGATQPAVLRGRPAAGRRGPAGLGTPVAKRPEGAVTPSPAAGPPETARRTGTAPPGGAGGRLGATLPGVPYSPGPEAAPSAAGPSTAAGPFVIAAPDNRTGRRDSPVKGRAGLLVLMGVATVSLVVIVILAVAAFTDGGGPRASAAVLRGVVQAAAAVERSG